MKVHAMGMGYSHKAGMIMDRPCGVGDDLLLIFKTPAVVRLSGVIRHVPADSAILYPANTPHYYGADNVDYINHWLHFEMNDAVFVAETGLPLNEIITIRDISAVEHYFELLDIENVSGGKNSQASCDLLIRLLLAKLAESSTGEFCADIQQTGSQHRAALRELRASVRRNPAERHSIPELAKRLALSVSHFQYLYKQEFGVSCHEDVISARLDMAEYYLKNTALPLRQIAEQCGYENDVHFMRQFRKMRGMTAGEYRKQNSSKKGYIAYANY